MKLKRTKKGFTIIELVIVIAVIGILAAVLIPTFVNLTNKANEASDNALVNNLNKALKMEEQEPGHEKSQTLEGAIKDLEDQGYILENLASKSGKDLLWSQSENQFLLNTEGKSGKDYWKIVDAVPAQDDQKYSYYAGKNFNQTDVTVKYGFDAGRIDNISKVTYVGTGTAQEVAIRTKGGTLTVNAPKDNVYHYGKVTDVLVKEVASKSFHENGVVSGSIYVTKGHVVLAKQVDMAKAATSIVVKGADVEIETADETPIILDGDVVVTEATKINGVKGTEEGFNEKVDATINKIGTVEQLAAAFEYGSQGGYYALSADIVTTSTYDMLSFGDVTLDLCGHSIVYDGDKVNFGFIFIYGSYGQLTVNDSVGTGYIDVDQKAYSVFQVKGFGPDYPDYPARLVVNNGSFKGNTAAITGNGSEQNWETDITINGGVFTAKSMAIYHPQNGVLKITGGSFTAENSALEMRAGTLRVSGGKFEATSTEYSCDPNGNGSTTVGSALAIVQHTTKSPISAKISGGSFKGHHALVMTDIQQNETSNVSVSITGGNFEGKVENLADPNWILVIK